MSDNKARYYSIDILRIIAMLGIVILHTQSKTGWLKGQKMGTVSWLESWGIQAVCMLAVNIYMLISGYFLPGTRRTTKKIFNLWGIAFFWSFFSILLEMVLTKKEIAITVLANTILPISTRQYWFLTVYVALYLISPFLDNFSRGLSRKQHKSVIIVLVILFSVLPTFIPYGGEDGVVGVNGIGGTNIAWFCVLYLISGYLKNYVSINELKKNRKRYCLVFTISVAIMLIFQLFMELLQERAGFGGSYGTWFFNYASIFNLSASIAVFALFLSFDFVGNNNLKQFISFLSGSTFGIYLIHENPQIRPILWGGVEQLNEAYLTNLYYPVKVLLVCSTIFVICCLMEQLRKSTIGKIAPKQIKFCQKIDMIFYPIKGDD